ncbi:beta-hydroxyacyl-ACP dehydratase [Amycolatopsis sp. NPDC004079]|uniref:3-hydroxyacyl-ACP dehydratase FabZ family protein n=1 Tax=Amycolatopsis sp. NPDC004079 TaxID=3154549 RepID=UPI0033ABE284
MAELPRLGHDAIRALLPHGWPVVLLDQVLDHVPGASLSAVKAISGCEPCFAQLPAGTPASGYAYPTSLLMESFGQAAAVLWLLGEEAREPDEVLMFAVARDCEFEGSAFPGDVLRHEVRLDHVLPGTAFATGETWAGRRRIARMGSFAAVTRPASRLPAPGGLPIDSSTR